MEGLGRDGTVNCCQIFTKQNILDYVNTICLFIPSPSPSGDIRKTISFNSFFQFILSGQHSHLIQSYSALLGEDVNHVKLHIDI